MKTQTMFKSIFGTAFIALQLLMVSCDAANNQSALVRHWRLYEGRIEKLRDMELFKDGTGVVQISGNYSSDEVSVSVSWKVEDKRFVIQSPTFAMTSDYKISDYRLAFISNYGDSTIYLEEAYYAAFKAHDAIESAAKSALDKAGEALDKTYGKTVGELDETIIVKTIVEAVGKVSGYSDKAIAETIKKVSDLKYREELKNINVAALKARWFAKHAGASDEAAEFASKKIDAEVYKSSKTYVAAFEAAKAYGASDESAAKTARKASKEARYTDVDKAAAAFKSAKAGGASYETAFEAAKTAIKTANSKKGIIDIIEILFKME